MSLAETEPSDAMSLAAPLAQAIWSGREKALLATIGRNSPSCAALTRAQIKLALRERLCGKPATSVCTVCVYEEGGWLCAECAKAHECGEEMLFPVVNSPRVGMCAYGAGYAG